jgi:hypothetical protein
MRQQEHDLMPTPTIFSYSIKDENGDPATTDLFVSYDAATETVAALLGAAAAYGGLIDAVTGGKITEFNVKINALPDPAWKAAAIADSDIQKSLLTNFNVTDTKYPQEVLIPALKGTLVGTDGKPILTAGGAIKALTDGLVAPSGGVSVQNKFLLDLTSLRDAAVSFRKRKGSLSRSRVEV